MILEIKFSNTNFIKTYSNNEQLSIAKIYHFGHEVSLKTKKSCRGKTTAANY